MNNKTTEQNLQNLPSRRLGFFFSQNCQNKKGVSCYYMVTIDAPLILDIFLRVN